MVKPVHRLRQIPLYAHLSILFIGLMVLYAVVSGIYQYRFTSRLMMDDAQRQFEQIGVATAAKVQALYRPAGSLAEQLAQQQLMSAGSLPRRLENLPFLVAGLQGLPAVSSIYVGYDNGDFFLVRPWQEKSELRQRLQPPPGTAWVVQSVSRDGAGERGEYLFFDARLTELGRRVDPLYRFDPRTRPWYGSAKQQDRLIVSQPYLFYTSRQAGVTFSRRAPSGLAVAGVDIELDDLSRMLLQSRITPDTRIALLNRDGEVLASHKGGPGLIHGRSDDGRLPLLRELDANVLQQLHQEAGLSGKHNLLIRNAAGDWQGVVIPVPVEGGSLLVLMLAAPHRELLSEAVRLRNHSLLISGGMLLLGVLLTIWLSRFAARSLRKLMKETAKIERFQFDEPVVVKTRIKEVAELAGAIGEMKSTIHRFLGMSMALASETHFPHLLARLLRTMHDVTGAQGGVVYLAGEEARHLLPVQAEWRGEPLEDADVTGGIDLNAATHPVAQALRNGSRVLSVPLDRLREDFPWLIDNETPLTLLVLPLHNRDRELLGVLVLFVDESDKALSPERLAFSEALSGTAAVALNTQRLLDEQKILLESIIQLLAGAIDAKSPYTGGHCQRVPELTRMLARAACDATDGPFAEYGLSDERWEAVRIAAWLHDCGKVTTPEYVVDKATKLETLYDRIHEIRMRFEVLKRDAEIAYWKQLAHGGDEKLAQVELTKLLAELDEEFAFVAACNLGSESMPPEHAERVRAIARRTWRRTLDDSLGISHEEMERKSARPVSQLPVEEPLLADKPEHIFARGAHDRIAADNPWGFKMAVPAHLYNRGEVYNLCVGYGTLTEEERYKINEHIIQTIIMLDRLPFPRHLRDVPEIAGGHHEKIDGSGYPKRLSGAEMSIEAKMIAIADIFEALTAVDRPYKRGKTLSDSLKIMQRMMWRQHIDPELFALFLRSGVYLDYARLYLRPEQIDAVDIEALLR